MACKHERKPRVFAPPARRISPANALAHLRYHGRCGDSTIPESPGPQRYGGTMSEIDRYRGFDGGLSRRTSRGLSQIQSGCSLAIARVEARTDIQAAQVDAVAAVAQRAMQGIAFVSQVE